MHDVRRPGRMPGLCSQSCVPVHANRLHKVQMRFWITLAGAAVNLWLFFIAPNREYQKLAVFSAGCFVLSAIVLEIAKQGLKSGPPK